MPPKKAGGKKNKKDEWDDDAAEKKIASLSIQKEESPFDEDEPVKRAPPKKNKLAAFSMLEDDDEVEEKEPSDEEQEVVVVEEKKTKKEKKKGKKDKKGKADDDDDLDAILASIESGEKAQKPKTAEPVAPPPAPVTAPASEPSAGPEEAVAEPVEGEAVEETDDKKKKNKKKKKGAKDKAEEDGEKEKEETPEPGPSKEKEDEEDAGSGDEAADDKDKKKKKKKKDKKEKKEKEEKPKKKTQIDKIKEFLKLQQEAKEEEERIKREEEARLEAIAKQQEEEERLAKERKEAEKERKRLAIEKQKAEGTYLSAAQRKKQQQTLEKLAAAGITLPSGREEAEETEKKKPVVYMDKRTLKRQQAREQKKKEKLGEGKDAAESAEPAEDSPEPVKEEVVEDALAIEEEEESKEAEEEEPLDDWEMAEEVEEKSEKVEKKDIAKPDTAPKDVAMMSDSSDDSEAESEEGSDEEEEESSSEDEAGKGRETKEQIMERVKLRIKKRREDAESKRSTDNLRSPVICVLGHVDTGKTKMLDTIRRTNVQGGEAGGITQQIGATEVPAEAIKERCRQVKDFKADAMKIPGFLIIDTPGHESFSNLRTRGSSLCDFAILVVDIMHGLEPQTIESLKLLLKGNTPFVVALNKIDRLYEYESNPRKDIYEHLKSQKTRVQQEFKERYEAVVVAFAEQGVNVVLSNKNKNEEEYVSVVPTSAYLGDGIGNIMSYIVNSTQTTFAKKVAFSEELDATVMEVKVIPGLGTTIDVILVNGKLKVGDIIVLTGSDGAVMTQVRELLMPKPLREMRVKNEYVHYKEVQGARGVKVLAKNLEKVLAGLPVFVIGQYDEVDYFKQEADLQLSKALHAIRRKPEGVYVQASTLGSLEALLDFLKSQKIPYSNVNIGPVHKRDVQKASAMKEHKLEYACILAFDVKVERDAQTFADQEGIKIFQADIIYHLQDSFLKYREELKEKARKDHEHLAIFPCKLRIIPTHIYKTRDPIIVGVSVEAGQVKRGTPICVPSKEGVMLGTVASIQRNNEEVPLAKQGDEICVKIENTTGEAPRLYGRHFSHEDILVSKISRDSIDVCKTYFRDDLTKADWQLIVQLKKVLDIM
ncbi:unnamed protein product [Caenorhabditis auriculariae]|uniref:Eukaryotic translation initiation factor 5B n=1 Tax=Caenorhabditis auriculariae TaxID=2777116 RepID=A0A8S1GZU5_9PELO|nr:unnamed protein product [Caenorhabditis auriculariae]